MNKTRKWSTTQFCPVCYSNHKITSVFLDETVKSLNCPIHGIIGYEDSKIAQYTVVEVVVEEPVVEEEIEEIEEIVEEDKIEELVEEPKPEKEKDLKKKLDFSRKK